ncbi:MAG: DUF4238 domain-containing protein [Lachnospiraceae bacterium]|nr:DUF4238 domain-containing protein [Lachnospiraceae bacterium]
MGKTKKQHYVPRMYIKRFGYGTEDNPRISVLKKAEGTVLHNQNPENFASKRFFYDTTEDVIEDVLKRDLEIFTSIKKSRFYHDEQLTEHTLSRMEGAYKELLDSIEANPEIIYEDKPRAIFISFVNELAYRTKSFRDRMDTITSKTEDVLSKMCDNLGLDEDTKRKTIEENCIPGINIQLENILSLGPTLQTMKILLENYDWFIGYNDTELDFVISDNPAQTVWCHLNDICIPISKQIAIVMRVKDDKAPMVSIDKAKDNIIDMSMKGVIAYNMMQISMAQLYLFGSEKAINFMKSINELLNVYGKGGE